MGQDLVDLSGATIINFGITLFFVALILLGGGTFLSLYIYSSSVIIWLDTEHQPINQLKFHFNFADRDHIAHQPTDD